MIEENVSDFKKVSSNESSIIVNDLLANVNGTLDKAVKRFEFLHDLTKITASNITFSEFVALWESYRNTPCEKALYDWVLIKREGERSTINLRIGSDIRRQIFEQVWNENYDYSCMSES